MYGNLDPIEHRAERVVIILVGLIGAGKVRRPPLFRVVRRVFLRLFCDATNSTLRSLCTQRRIITRVKLLNDTTVTIPVSLHSQKPFRNTSRRSGGATKTSLVIVAESRKPADHVSGKAFPSA